MNDDLEDELREFVAGAQRAFSPSLLDARRVRNTIDRTLADDHKNPCRDGAAHRRHRAAMSGKALPIAALVLCVLGVLGAVTQLQQPTAPAASAPATANSYAAPNLQRAIAPAPSTEVPVSQAPSASPAVIQPMPSGSARPVGQRKAASGVRNVTRARREAGSTEPLMASLQIEIAALRRVELALREGRAQQALSTLDELDRIVPNGKLTEERAAAFVVARCTLEPAARTQLLRAYRLHHPNTMFTRRVEASCGAAHSSR